MRPISTALLTLGLISTSLAANAQSESYTTPGSVIDFTVTQSGLYDINVQGGAGGLANSSSGASAGGNGADISGDVYLNAGTTLGIVVGDQGGAGTTYQSTSTSSTSYYAGGGGGGSFVYVLGNANPLLVAGGGGGGGYGETGKNASLTTSGSNGGGVSPGAGLGGTGGLGGPNPPNPISNSHTLAGNGTAVRSVNVTEPTPDESTASLSRFTVPSINEPPPPPNTVPPLLPEPPPPPE